MLLCRSFFNPPVAYLARDKCRCHFFAAMQMSLSCCYNTVMLTNRALKVFASCNFFSFNVNARENVFLFGIYKLTHIIYLCSFVAYVIVEVRIW